MSELYVADFRWGISDLCHKNRYSEDDTLCSVRKTEAESEIHFFLKCPAYVSIRQQYIPANHSSASLQEYFKVAMSNNESAVIYPVAAFLHLTVLLRSRSEYIIMIMTIIIYACSLLSVCVCACVRACVRARARVQW